MLYVVTAEEMQALDAATIQDMGLPGAVLMENAGRRVADVILGEIDKLGQRGRLGRVQPGAGSLDAAQARSLARVAVVCGAGNNGGDGYVIARYLRDHDVPATVYLCVPPNRLRGDARLHFDAYLAMGHPVRDISDSESLTAYSGAIESADVAVDGLFGTGLTRAIGGHYRAVVDILNRSRGVRVAIDVPSGLSANTGQVLGVAVAADITVTMAFLKVGLAIAPGFARAGRVEVAEIGIPARLAGKRGVCTVMTQAGDLRSLVPELPLLTHKNRRGHLLVIAGSPGKRGAARLTAWAAMRAGAGLVTLASPWHGTEPGAPDPVMTAELPDDGGERLVELARGKRAVAIGPGMATDEQGRALVYRALGEIEAPTVLDADALNHLGIDLAAVANAAGPVVITPHPGEAARLLGTTSADIESNRLAAVRELAHRSRAVAILKGARSLICDGRTERTSQRRVAINPTGTPGLATAGSGDVLTGIVGALLAQGLDPFDAAQLGVYAHGRTGELAVHDLGGTLGVTAQDLSQYIATALTELRPTAHREQ